MSTRRPDWWPPWGAPVRCPIRSTPCCRYVCSEGIVCEERNALALVPMEPKPDTPSGVARPE